MTTRRNDRTRPPPPADDYDPNRIERAALFVSVAELRDAKPGRSLITTDRRPAKGAGIEG